jgi:protein-tyrosine-phosphatase
MSKKAAPVLLRVLFVDQKNDFVSQLAEHFAREMFPSLYETYSAGPEKDIVDCEMISVMYQNGEDIRRNVSKDFKDRDYLRADEQYDFVIYMEKATFDEWAPRTPWKGKQILAPMRTRKEYTATDDAELYDDYVKSIEEVKAWVSANMDDPEKLKALVTA